MRLLYLGDTASPHFRAWPSYFAEAGYDVHVCHLAARAPGPAIPGTTVHPAPRPARGPVRGAWTAAALGLRRLRKRLQPDLVHSQQIIPAGVVAELAGAAPHISTAWGSEVLLASTPGRVLLRRVCRRAALLTADSRHLLNALEDLGADPGRLRWVPWGVRSAWREAAQRLSPRSAAERLGLPSDRALVLSPRGATALYRQDVFVRAMASLRERRPELLGVVLALDPTQTGGRRALERMIAELRADACVTVVPPYPHERMPLAYRAAAVCVSVPESDSAPLSVIEALSLGTPAIVSALPWVHEPVYREARLGLVPVGDHEALARAIDAAVSKPSASDVEANLRLVECRFDRERIFGQFDSEYRALINGADGDAPG